MTTSHTVRLRVTHPDGACTELTADAAQPTWIGRDESCQVVVTAGVISRRHAVVEVINDELRISDVSANGIQVNGMSLHRASRFVGRAALLAVGPYRIDVTLAGDVAVQACVATPAQLSVAQRRRVHRLLLDHLDLAHFDRAQGELEVLRPRVIEALGLVLTRLSSELPADLSRDAVIAELTDEALGLGPLESLLADDRVSEIMVVDPETIFAERDGRLEQTGLRFTDDDAVRAVIERIVTPLGRRIDESVPLVDARLKDGSRVNAVIPPLAVKGAAITIRKFTRKPLRMPDLVQRHSLTDRMALLLQRVVKARKNILIAGGTGSGKTTLLNLLAASIPERERVVTIEDAAELRLEQPHVVSLESRPPNMEGKGAFTIRDLVRNALRMRPDRIVVGECRGGEALDMLQAMNTGHDGSMTTLHANSPREAVARLETLCLMAGLDLPVPAIRAQIASSVHVIVQQARFSDGSRRVTSIAEVSGLSDSGQVIVNDVFVYRRTGTDGERVVGEFCATGYIPSFVDELIASGLVPAGDYL